MQGSPNHPLVLKLEDGFTGSQAEYIGVVATGRRH